MSPRQQQQATPVAIVTGASGGIGEATARALAQAGWRVFGTSRKTPARPTSGVEHVACDVTRDDSVQDAIAQVLGKAGRIDLLINNAGIGLIGGAEESSLDQAKSLFDVNVFGVIRTIKAVLPAMRRQRSGRIVNISSVMGFIPAPYFALYAATKHALEGYSESLDHEVRDIGVRVVLVEPAYTRTSFESNLIQADQPLGEYAPARSNAEAVMREVMMKADLPEVVAAAVLNASTAAKPSARYAAGGFAKQVSLLRRFVPRSAFDKSLRKQLRMPA
jgi:short-subunit dehydrogenase